MTIKQKQESRPVIDLTGPDGNAWALIGHAKRFARELGLDGDAISEEMRGGDYKNLLAVFEKYFGDYVTLLVDSDEKEEEN